MVAKLLGKRCLPPQWSLSTGGRGSGKKIESLRIENGGEERREVKKEEESCEILMNITNIELAGKNGNKHSGKNGGLMTDDSVRDEQKHPIDLMYPK